MPKHSRYLAVLVLLAACDSSGPSSSPPASLAGRILFIAAATNGITHADIYSIKPDGSDLVNLTKQPAYYESPAVSPNGRLLAFYANATGPADSGDVWVMNADGTGRHQITHTDAHEEGLAWSPDGLHIAFVKNRDIYVMSADGADTTRLTFDATDFKATPAWSPDGSHIAYSRYVGSPAGYELHRMTATGLNDTLLLALNGDDFWPTWSPDAHTLYFVHRDVPQGRLMTLSLGTGDTTSLTGGQVIDQFPALSPTGDTLVFSRTIIANTVQPQEVYLLIPPSSTPVPVTSFGTTLFTYNSTWAGHP